MAKRPYEIDDEVIHTRLENGQNVCIRTISEDDRGLMQAGIEALSPQSRYLRFFSAAKSQPKVVIDQLLDTEGDDHLAWGAIDMDLSNRPAIGAVHAIQKDKNEAYEFSVAVLDAYQGEGLGTLLTAVVLVNCKALGITTLHAHALLENRSAISLLSTLDAELIETHSAVSEYRLDVAKALQELKNMERTQALKCVLDRLEKHI